MATNGEAQMAVDSTRLRVHRKKPLIYIADSKLISGPNLDRLAEENLLFISRLPGNFKLDDQLKARAWEQNDWQSIGALSRSKDADLYRSQSFEAEIEDRTYRFKCVDKTVRSGRS